MHLFEGILDNFDNFEWNFRDIRYRFLVLWILVQNAIYDFINLRILFKIISGIRDTGDPTSRAS